MTHVPRLCQGWAYSAETHLWLATVQASILPCSEVGMGWGTDPGVEGGPLVLVSVPAQQGARGPAPGCRGLGRVVWRRQGWELI